MASLAHICVGVYAKRVQKFMLFITHDLRPNAPLHIGGRLTSRMLSQ